MRTVMIFGTFDLLHEGHKSFIGQARQEGDMLIVVVARDQTVLKLKKRLPDDSEKVRQQKIRALKIADKVILGSTKHHLEKVKRYRPDIIVLGYDQGHFANTLEQDLKSIGLEDTIIKRAVAYHPEKYKTSLLRPK